MVSRATNQVYDISERKKFCSGNCFRASNFIHVQLLTSPLWLRDQETIPEFRLMDGWREAVKQQATNTVEPTDVTQPSLVVPIEEDMQKLTISSEKNKTIHPDIPFHVNAFCEKYHQIHNGNNSTE